MIKSCGLVCCVVYPYALAILCPVGRPVASVSINQQQTQGVHYNYAYKRTQAKPQFARLSRQDLADLRRARTSRFLTGQRQLSWILELDSAGFLPGCRSGWIIIRESRL